MSAIYAPKLIILDEPITNMDDMHILNLIDIIRELVLNGTQIIITTANDQIAKFLRRKFSCMEDSFKHIILNRINDNQTQIFEVIYSPNEEGYKSKTEII
jgi:exonuclease SbcC